MSDTAVATAARAVDPSGGNTAAEPAARLDPAAHYDPPTVDAKPPPRLVPSASAPDFPNLTLYDHDGQEVKFYDDLVRGKIVVINFMYATCTGT